MEEDCEMIELEEFASKELAVLAGASPDQYQKAMFGLGTALAAKYVRSRKPRFNRFHVLTAVEDFEGITAGVIHRLRRLNRNEVTYSCMWPRPRLINKSASIEICPIDQAFHQEPEGSRYHLLLVAANIGSMAATEAMLLNAIIDRHYNGSEDIDILSPVVRSNALEYLNQALPQSWAWSGRVRLTKFRQDPTLTPDGFTVPGVGGAPASMAGFRSSEEREEYIPAKIREDFNFPLDPGPEPQPMGNFII